MRIWFRERVCRMPGDKVYRIAISGKASSGKSTVASFLGDALGLRKEDVRVLALADPMKQIAQIMFPAANAECLYGPSELRSKVIDPEYIDENKKPLSYRQFLLDFGKFGRNYNKDIWVKCLAEEAKKSTHKAYIVSDVRMHNEYTHLRANGFTMIRVVRGGCKSIDDISETEQDSLPGVLFDHIIYNDLSIHDLFSRVKYIAQDLKGLNNVAF